MDESIAKARNRLVMRSRRFSDAWDAFTREFDLQELKIDPEAIFAGVRDRAPGRDAAVRLTSKRRA